MIIPRDHADVSPLILLRRDYIARRDEFREGAIKSARTHGPTPSEKTRGVARPRGGLPVLSIPSMKLRSHEERTKRYREQCRIAAVGWSRRDSRSLTIV